MAMTIHRTCPSRRTRPARRSATELGRFERGITAIFGRETTGDAPARNPRVVFLPRIRTPTSARSYRRAKDALFEASCSQHRNSIVIPGPWVGFALQTNNEGNVHDRTQGQHVRPLFGDLVPLAQRNDLDNKDSFSGNPSGR